MSPMPEEEEIQSGDEDFSREDQENINKHIKHQDLSFLDG